MDIVNAIKQVADGQDLTRAQMLQVMTQIMTGKASDAQIGGLLIGLHMKGESIAEITGAVESMRSLATRVNVSPGYLVDTCGTGGSGSSKFNVSTASAMVAAAAGLLMGQAAEGLPVVVVNGLNLPTTDGKASDLNRPRELDMYR